MLFYWAIFIGSQTSLLKLLLEHGMQKFIHRCGIHVVITSAEGASKIFIDILDMSCILYMLCII